VKVFVIAYHEVTESEEFLIPNVNSFQQSIHEKFRHCFQRVLQMYAI
jgi:hypothetical protein